MKTAAPRDPALLHEVIKTTSCDPLSGRNNMLCFISNIALYGNPAKGCFFPTTLEAPLLSFSRALDQIKPSWVVGTISTNLICSLSFLLSKKKKSSPLCATSSHEVTAVLARAFKRLTSNSQEHSLPTDAWIIFSYTRPTQEKPETLISSSPTFSFCWPSLIQLWFSSLVCPFILSLIFPLLIFLASHFSHFRKIFLTRWKMKPF